MRHNPKTIQAADEVMGFIEQSMRVESEMEDPGGISQAFTSEVNFTPLQQLEIYDLMEKFRKGVLSEQ